MRRIFKYLIIIILLSGCREDCTEIPSDGGDVRTGNLVLSLGTSLGTKAAEDGGTLINDLVFYLLDTSNSVVECGNSFSTAPFDGLSIADDGLSAHLSLKNIKRGSYKLYVAANIPSTLKAQFESISAGTVLTDDFFNAVLPSVGTSLVPPYGDSYDDAYMPLSLEKDISIYAGENVISGELVRCCARVRIEIINSTSDFNFFATDVTLSDANPNQAYLFQNGHTVPSGTSLLSFRNYSVSGATSLVVAPGERQVYTDQFLYETGSSSMTGLGLIIKGGLFQSTTAEVERRNLTKTIYKAGDMAQYPTSTSESYLIRNAALKYYLKADGTSVEGRICPNIDLLMLDSEMSSYLWTFSATSSPASVQNVESGSYVNIASSGVTLGSAGQSLTFGEGSADNSMYLSDGSNYLYGTYSEGESLTVNSTLSDNTSWIVIPVSANTATGYYLVDTTDESLAVKDVDISIPALTYINGSGQSEALSEICRNDDLYIKVYVHYTPSSSVLYFEVDAWKSIDNQITFD